MFDMVTPPTHYYPTYRGRKHIPFAKENIYLLPKKGIGFLKKEI